MKIRNIKYENKSAVQICIPCALVSGHLLCKRNQIQYLSKIAAPLMMMLEYAKRSLHFFSIKKWNDIPDNIRE